ncbi:PLP-dependent aminotransferase family protein [Nocardioides euryhalodurans]|uniref:PLP-dependent aminotransferase family protein n=1 Tax=Nocardioides euryhalodurans TaxID=2518370 RepID=A0A4P7GQ93_9ACTN|nr:PLP-dependent aminotransferase family protein [Nocardioides euryhalodurans]QBR94001.1 PLP-dependent aminotransferase family protein [Nocardioides euryhalodurans]
MQQLVSAHRTATLVGDFPRSPAYAGLAEALRRLVADGRIPVGARLPSERDLTRVLDVSRTTVTRAYASLVEQGYAEPRRGSGTFTRLPGEATRVHDRALLPRPDDAGVVDLNCAAPAATWGIAAAYERALAVLPSYLAGHGYFPVGLPALQQAIASSYEARGLPTSPDQVMVTPGALAAAAIVSRALTGAGDRVLVESPCYPNAVEALRDAGARLVPSPVDPDGWDLPGIGAGLHQVAPRLAFLIPDFQNPTGLLMPDEQREEYAGHLRRARVRAVVDEAHQWLPLEGQAMPLPFAAHAPGTVTVGSASKGFWGGLRVGWIRAPEGTMDSFVRARLALDLGAPVLEQLVLVELLRDADRVVGDHRHRLREQRDALADAVSTSLPDWRFRLPSGGLALWCELPAPLATALAAEGDRRGVVVAPGPVFAAEGGLARFVRLPWTRPVGELQDAVARLAEAWSAVLAGHDPDRRPSSRVMVA